MTKGRKLHLKNVSRSFQLYKHSHNYSEQQKISHSYQQARSYTIRYEEQGGWTGIIRKEKIPEETFGSIGGKKGRSKTSAEKTGRNRDIFLKKIRRDREEGRLSPDTPGTYLSGNQEGT